MRKTFSLFTLAALAFAFVITADFGSLSMAANPCKADQQRLCGDVKPGGGRILNCLKLHEDSVSQECKAHVQAQIDMTKKKFRTWKEACEKDVQRLCPDVPLGQGRIINCLKAHKAQVSPECRGKLGK